MYSYLFKNKNFINILIFILFILSYFFYFLSLEKCFEGEGICCIKHKWMKKKVIDELISIILTIILLELIIVNKISKLHIIHFIIVYILFYNYSNGIDFDDHGYYNIKYFIFIVIFFLVILFFINIFLTKGKKFAFIIVLSILLLFYSFGNKLSDLSSCFDWANGLNNTSIDNDKKKYSCMIKIPKYCVYKIGRFFLDKDRFSSCSKQLYNPRELILKISKSPFIDKNTLHIGFPLTNKDEKFLKDMGQKAYKNYYFKNFIDMNNETLIKSLNGNIPEVSVDFSKNKDGDMNINLNFNKTLSDERKELEKSTKPYINNILILFIDSVSRANSMRQLKKTLNFFENFMSYKGNKSPKNPQENYHSFQFFKYHSHKFYTSGNYPILFYGKHRNETNKYIAYYLKKNGFITGYSADECFNDFTRSFHNFSFEEVYDHQYVICDPNYRNLRSKLNCFYGKLHVEYMFEYMNQFWIKYQNNRKFSLMLTNFAHENTLEKLKYIDNIIYNYFTKLFNDNLLKDTCVILLSDHGVAVPSIYYLNDFFKIEKVLPMFYLLINDKKNKNYESQYYDLYNNQQTFITGFDIYDTIIFLIYGDKYGTNVTENIISKSGKNLFTKINPKKRNPKNYKLMDTNICI